MIFIPGGPCGEIALHAAELYHQGYAPLLIPSGKHSILDPITAVLSHRKNTVDENSRQKQIFSQRSFWIRTFLPPVSDRSARLLSLMRMPSIPESLRMRSVLPSGRQSFPARPITHGVHSFTIRLFFRMRRSWFSRRHAGNPKGRPVPGTGEHRLRHRRKWNTAAASSMKLLKNIPITPFPSTDFP